LQLAGIAAKVSRMKTTRFVGFPGDGDEVGTLVSSFNQMLERIQNADAALQGAKEKLDFEFKRGRRVAEGSSGTAAGGNRNAPGERGREEASRAKSDSSQHEPRKSALP